MKTRIVYDPETKIYTVQKRICFFWKAIEILEPDYKYFDSLLARSVARPAEFTSITKAIRFLKDQHDIR